MDHNHMSLDLRGKKIVSVTNGEIIGEVVDVLVDPEERYVAALITSKGNLFRRETQMLARDDISVIGKHVILSTQPDVVRNREDFNTADQWVAVSDHLRGNDVVTSDGTRVGRLQDIIIDPHGQIIAYALSNVAVSGPIADSKQIPAESIQSFGKDVVIVDPAVIHTQKEAIRTEADRTDIFGRDRTEEEVETEQSTDYERQSGDDYSQPMDRDYSEETTGAYREEPVEDYQKPHLETDEEHRRRDEI
jgi:uncharacterized protein YrrD